MFAVWLPGNMGSHMESPAVYVGARVCVCVSERKTGSEGGTRERETDGKKDRES